MHVTTRKKPWQLRRALAALTAVVAVIVAAGIGTGSAFADPPEQVPGIDYATAPSDLAPPPISVLHSSSQVAPGDVFVAPKIVTPVAGQQGPEIVDNQGRALWFQSIDQPYTATDFRVQTYRGKPVLTYDVGQSTGGPGHSEGEDVILDQHYNQIATVKAGNGLAADQHEFDLTPSGTALITIYHQVPYDLSAVGGPANGSVLDGIVQEVDVASGQVLFQWDSLAHVPITDSYQPVPTDPATPYDYFHINSVNLDTDGNLLISARHTWTVYKVDHQSGDVIWRLGGKESDFKLGPGVQTSWQHNALPEAGQPNTIRIFDNGSNGVPVEPESRIIDVKIDTTHHKATLVSQVTHPDHLSAPSQGNAQRLPDGHLFVGWGALGRVSEFDTAGNLLWDGQTPVGYDTYRAYRSPWVGKPDTDPTATVERTAKNRLTAEATWNGATQVTTWLLLGGKHASNLQQLDQVPWNGLHTELDVRGAKNIAYVRAVALDANGRTIGRSPLVPVGD